MEYEFSTGEPVSESAALTEVEAMGLHGLAVDEVVEQDEELHWHEYDFVAVVISGSGSFADEHGAVTRTSAGCRLRAPAGWLHRTLAGTDQRIVLGASLPGEQWTAPLNKDPADRPASLAT